MNEVFLEKFMYFNEKLFIPQRKTAIMKSTIGLTLGDWAMAPSANLPTSAEHPSMDTNNSRTDEEMFSDTAYDRI